MSNIKIKSENIKVYPSAFRGSVDGNKPKYNPEARLNTEYNVTNLVNRIVSKDSFVISWDDGSNLIKFNIHGYYFEANIETVLDEISGNNLYAQIKILPFSPDDKDNTSYKAFTLVGAEDIGDSEGTIDDEFRTLDREANDKIYFYGVNFSADKPTSTPSSSVYALHLLEKKDSEWKIPSASKLKFKDIEIETDEGNNIREILYTNEIEIDSNSTTKDFNLAGSATKIDVGGSNTHISLNTTKDITSNFNTGVTVGGGVGVAKKLIVKGTTELNAGAAISQDSTSPTPVLTINQKQGDGDIAVFKFSGDEKSRIDKTGKFIGNVKGDVEGNATTATSAEKLATSAGSKIKPIYFKEGKPVASDATVGTNDASGVKPIYLNSGELTAVSESVGTALIPIFMGSGVLKPISTGIGSASQPIYLSSIGFQTLSSANGIGSSTNPIYLDSSGKIVASSGTTVGSSSRPVYFNAGEITEVGVISPTYGGTGVNNGTRTLTIGDKTHTGSIKITSNGSDPRTLKLSGRGATLASYDNDGVTTLYWGDYKFDTKAVAKTLVMRDLYGDIYATQYFASSDRRLKENIEEFKYTKSILDVPVKTFDFIDGDKNQIGFIAQDLQEVYPELVTQDENGKLSIAENKIVYLLLEEIKILKEEIKELKEK